MVDAVRMHGRVRVASKAVLEGGITAVGVVVIAAAEVAVVDLVKGMAVAAGAPGKRRARAEGIPPLLRALIAMFDKGVKRSPDNFRDLRKIRQFQEWWCQFTVTATI